MNGRVDTRASPDYSNSVMQQLREQHSQLMGEVPVELSSTERPGLITPLGRPEEVEGRQGGENQELNPPITSVGNVFLEIEDKRNFPKHSGYPVPGCLPITGDVPDTDPTSSHIIGRVYGDAVSALGVTNLMVTMGKHPQQATMMVEFTIVDMSEGAYNELLGGPHSYNLRLWFP
ncbi:hypothetical protein LIER_18503 [Lithospermum erythrorhizon]|uniref:Uncharacterized protein n=1 Tax=Lithospermum erythrorhizon TaxID=34254 RepID=A0AAV3QE75_LITER